MGSRLADHGSVYGAAALVLHHFLSPPSRRFPLVKSNRLR